MLLSIGELVEETKDSVKNIPSNPIENLGFLFPVAMCCVSIVGALVSCILFAVQGGYSTQILLLKQSGISGISAGFTSGNNAILTSGIVGKIVLGLLACELVITVIACFLAAGKAKRIGLITDLAIMGIVIALLFVLTTYRFTDEQAAAIIKLLARLSISSETLLHICLAVVLAAIVAFIVLTVTSKFRWMLGYSCLSAAFSFIAAPLFVMLMENIIPLVLGALIIVVVGGIITFLIKLNSDDVSVKILNDKNDGSDYECTFINGELRELKKRK